MSIAVSESFLTVNLCRKYIYSHIRAQKSEVERKDLLCWPRGFTESDGKVYTGKFNWCVKGCVPEFSFILPHYYNYVLAEPFP